jgi:transposase InsO family protein
MNAKASVACKEWFTAAELAFLTLPGLPATKRGVAGLAEREGWANARNDNGPLMRERTGRGGKKWEYHLSILPEAAKARLLELVAEAEPSDDAKADTRESVWARYERLPATLKAKAQQRLDLIQRIEKLERAGVNKTRAVEEVVAQASREAKAAGLKSPTLSTVFSWLRMINGVAPADRVAYLAPLYQGRTDKAGIDEQAWKLYKGYYLTPSKPTHAAAYAHVADLAAENGWTLPSARTFVRRLDAEISQDIQTLMRSGEEALAHAFPHLQRDRSGLRPMQKLNLDGHHWDVEVTWPDGTRGRPWSLAVQDIASGKCLAVRFDKSLNQHLVRLALGDTFKRYGLPEAIHMDNGRENAALSISGGQATRWRWKPREEEPDGLLKLLGIEAVWAKPYWGQAKPIERMFRNWAHEIAKHPAFVGAYTGHNTVAKPSNRGERAVPFAEFEQLVRLEIERQNARLGRTGIGMNRRSFDQAFAEGIAQHGTIMPTAEQLRLCLLASQPVSMDPRTGAVKVFDTRFWSEELGARKRSKVIVRFDPEDLKADACIYTTDGVFICRAKALPGGSFDNVHEAQEQGRKVRAYKKAVKIAAKLQVELSPAEVAAALNRAPTPAPVPLPTDPKIVRPAFGAPRSETDFLADWSKGAQRLTSGG